MKFSLILLARCHGRQGLALAFFFLSEGVAARPYKTEGIRKISRAWLYGGGAQIIKITFLLELNALQFLPYLSFNWRV